jgi:hypothetical protein
MTSEYEDYEDDKLYKDGEEDKGKPRRMKINRDGKRFKSKPQRGGSKKREWLDS